MANPRRSQLVQLCLQAWLICLCSCEAEPDDPSQPDAAVAETSSVGSDGRPKLCARVLESSDAVRDVFCGAVPAQITSLEELKRTLTSSALGIELNRSVAFELLLGHSTSLSGHLVSSINPRSISILAPGPAPVSTFTRGVQQVELTVLSRDRTERRFYLVRFKQACNAQPGGCNPADLYTLRAEEGWQDVELSDDEELKNTPLDCRQCHQRGRSEPIVLMREVEAPWLHFFEPLSQEDGLRIPGPLNSELTRDYLAARGDELYAGADVNTLLPASGSMLQFLAGGQQPLIFASMDILNERWPPGPDGQIPAEPQVSRLWESAYAAFKRGEQLALPYFDQRATDPGKLAQLTAAYAAHRAGQLDESELPDLSDVFPDDGLLRARIGLQTEPDAAPVDTLIQACGACHNDVLDQSISRARFNIDLSRMSDAQIELAIKRMQRASDEVGVMPPPEARQLDPDGRERLIAYLRSDAARSGAPVEALVYAARIGMAGVAATGSASATSP